MAEQDFEQVAKTGLSEDWVLWERATSSLQIKWLSIARAMQPHLAQSQQERDLLKQQLATSQDAYLKELENYADLEIRIGKERDLLTAQLVDPNVVHTNILGGTIALTKAAAIHVAGLPADIEQQLADAKAQLAAAVGPGLSPALERVEAVALESENERLRKVLRTAREFIAVVESEEGLTEDSLIAEIDAALAPVAAQAHGEEP